MNTVNGRRVLVLGLGASGLAMARWCLRQGAAQVRVWDSREQPPMLDALRRDAPGAQFSATPPTEDDWLDLHAVFKSPGLAPHEPRVAAMLAAARGQRLWVGTELDLFAAALKQLQAEQGYQPKVLAITGTNGKTTTTALTGLLLSRCGWTVAVAGNIGPTLLNTLAEALDAQALPQAWVLELSSFQLDGVVGFEPDAAVVLNLSQDHLDWHGSVEAYAAAKARVYGPPPTGGGDEPWQLARTVMVVNRDDPAVMGMVPAPLPVKGARGKAAQTVERSVVGFGLDTPQRAGDFGWVTRAGMGWLVRALDGDGEVGEPLPLQTLMPADALRIRGRHNAANALAALALATAVGAPLAPMLHGLREYTGEPHRVEPVLRLHDVEYYDDSKGTNVGATVAAIRGLGHDHHPKRLVMLMGGDGKGQDFSDLREPLAQHARAVALYGRDAPRLAQALDGVPVGMATFDTLEEAATWARAQAQAGDAVVLSPACASLDQFRDYSHRAQVFVDLVRSWAADAGVGA